MWRIIVLTLSILATANSYTSRSSQRPYSAASETQIEFAIENKYDDTGPGAKGPEYAYHTYKTLEDALVGYLDDPDTKLPDTEREKALNILEISEQRDYNPSSDEYNGYTKQAPPPKIPLYLPNQQFYQKPVGNYGYLDQRLLELNDIPTRSYQKERHNNAISYQNVQSAKGSPLNLAHYRKDAEVQQEDQFDHNPHYSFSYGVHDKRTGDSKSAQETRADGVVRGFYSFMDADGKQRTVHYTADDKQGFQATVRRSHPKPQ